ncbi:tripartite tricarboxylate transporter permease [Roseomonas marmotae]|uniref:Tripartite tricarboxylate transporter permease n=1 Tax=Roseomonas marmotae TaxID=2768161 RepID=A0ABS3K840_9PROT|nr:tripartite tricarboxylate transporter permease [Roseomonas marmotae]MBO1073634.1 tripartite tricarboxylate transporter permease [Roseomonas marmotae]MBO1073664.1 tripartite tricarboxylate transporter permease [Roseomonas marmotae]QTI80188.1 tripartite tricarboxylate transporter permease [Roseomonas marmotae]
MDMFSNLALGFGEAFAMQNLLYCFFGVFLGTFIGVLPGIGPLATISMLLPLTFHVPPTAAIIMLAGIYYGAQYGGSTASILMNLPGTPAAAVVCLDGYPMAKQGRAGVALFMTTIASFVGSTIGIIILTAFSPTLASVALAFGPADYFSMMLLGLIAAAALAQGSPAKGIAMVLLGLALGMIGTDVQTGQQRFTFGIPQLSDGLNLVAVAMGLFGVSEVITSIMRMRDVNKQKQESITMRSMLPRADDVKRSWRAMLRGSGVGSFFGTLPGAGTTIAAFIAYAVEKRMSRQPERFGKGAVEGISAPESASNASAQTAFIPTLTLGIPGDAVMALMLGAMIIQGIQPGPRLVSDHPELFWGLIASFWIGNVMLVILNIPMIGLWVRMLRIPYGILYPSILLFICIGVFSVNNSAFDVLLVMIFGVIGYGMVLLKFEPAPLILGFILGPLMEEHLRRAMLLSRGDLAVFIERPISASFLAVTASLLAWSVVSMVKQTRTQRRAAVAAGL